MPASKGLACNIVAGSVTANDNASMPAAGAYILATIQCHRSTCMLL